jgi:NAD(P)-dependent dehydrogenase (short-subunit alcohol dehydrogenase family)
MSSQPPPRLAGKRIAITGGNSGIGRATAEYLAREGARVAVLGRDARTLDDTARALGEGALTFRGDVTDAADVDAFFSLVEREFGGLDGVFVNAGLAQPTPFGETLAEAFDLHFDVNVKGAFFTAQRAAKALTDGGSIVFTGSAVDERGMAGFSVYAATKAAVRSLARSLTQELAPRGIRVNVVAPGPIETPIFGRMGLPEAQVEEFGAQILEGLPAGRFGQPEEVAAGVAFLLSDESTYLRGSRLAIDGGFSQV